MSDFEMGTFLKVPNMAKRLARHVSVRLLRGAQVFTQIVVQD
jgi:hypothetical protein